jgi:hypothetical protein
MGLNPGDELPPPEETATTTPWARWLWISMGVTLLVLIICAVIYGWTKPRGWVVYAAENSGLVNELSKIHIVKLPYRKIAAVILYPACQPKVAIQKPEIDIFGF